MLLNIPLNVSASATNVFDEGSSGNPSTLVELNSPESWQVKVPILTTLEIQNSSRLTSIRSLYVSCNVLANLSDEHSLLVEPELDLQFTRIGDDMTAEAGLSGYDDQYLIEKNNYYRSGGSDSRYVCLPDLPAGKWVSHAVYNIEVKDRYDIGTTYFYKYKDTDPCPIEILDGTYDDYYEAVPYYNATKIKLLDGYTDSTGVYHDVKAFDLSSWSKLVEIETDRTKTFSIRSLPSSVTKIDCNGTDIELRYINRNPNNPLKISNAGNVSLISSYATAYADGYDCWDMSPDEYNIKNVYSSNGLFTRDDEFSIPEDIHTDYDYLSIQGHLVPNLKKLTIPDMKYIKYVKEYSPGDPLSSLEELYYNESRVEKQSFLSCANLKKVTLGPNCSYVDEAAFAGCTSLEEVIIENSNLKLYASSFAGSPWYTNILNEANHGVLKIGNSNLTFIVKDTVDEEMIFDYEDWNNYTDHIINLSLVPSGTKILRFSDRFKNKFKYTDQYDNVYTGYWTLQNSVPDIELADLSELYLGTYYMPNFANAKKVITPYAVKTYAATKYDGYTNCNRGTATMPLLDISKSEFLVDMSMYNTFDTSYFEIPNTIKRMGDSYNYSNKRYYAKNPFMDFGKDGIFNEFRASQNVDGFKSVDGILYSGDGVQLISIPNAKQFEDNHFVIPEGVECSTSYAIDGTIIDDITLPNTWDISKSVNPSLLNVFTNCHYIKRFHVHDDNPNLYEVNGILYTKDGNYCYAIPYGYEGEIAFPENCKGFYNKAVIKYWDIKTNSSSYESSGEPVIEAYTQKPYDSVTKWKFPASFSFANNSSENMDVDSIIPRFFNRESIVNKVEIDENNTSMYKYTNGSQSYIQIVPTVNVYNKMGMNSNNYNFKQENIKTHTVTGENILLYKLGFDPHYYANRRNDPCYMTYSPGRIHAGINQFYIYGSGTVTSLVYGPIKLPAGKWILGFDYGTELIYDSSQSASVTPYITYTKPGKFVAAEGHTIEEPYTFGDVIEISEDDNNIIWVTFDYGNSSLFGNVYTYSYGNFFLGPVFIGVSD